MQMGIKVRQICGLCDNSRCAENQLEVNISGFYAMAWPNYVKVKIGLQFVNKF